jgi:hypothetical protein
VVIPVCGDVSVRFRTRQDLSGTRSKLHSNNIDILVDLECLAIGSGSQFVGGEVIVERWEWKRKEVETRSRWLADDPKH